MRFVAVCHVESRRSRPGWVRSDQVCSGLVWRSTKIRRGASGSVTARLVKAVAARRTGFGMPRPGKVRRSLYGAVCCVTVSRGMAVN